MCAACEEQEPFVQAFERAHFGKVIVLRLNPNLADYRIGKWSPKKTPSFVVLEDGQALRRSEGELLDADALERFVFDDSSQVKDRGDDDDEEDNPQHDGA
jgi:hypothetical protein